MKTIGSLLSSIFNNFGIEDKIKLDSMQKQWHSLFNEPLSVHTYPVEIKNGELAINVDSPAWLAQLKFFRQDIIKKLHAYSISSVKFKHGRVYSKGNKGSTDQEIKRQRDPKQSSKCITDSELAWINQTISTVSDFELQENIRKAILKAVTNNKKTATSDE